MDSERENLIKTGPVKLMGSQQLKKKTISHKNKKESTVQNLLLINQGKIGMLQKQPFAADSQANICGGFSL